MNYLLSKAQYQSLVLTIKDKTAFKTLTSSDIILYNIVRGKPLTNGFSPLTNLGRLNAVPGVDYGGGEYYAFNQAKATLKSLLTYKPTDIITMFNNELSVDDVKSILNELIK